MANTVVSVKIQLENGQYLTASNEVIRSTQKVERESARSMSKLDKVGETFSRRMRRYFSLGALFGGAFLTAFRAVSALFGAIGKGLSQAIDNNKALKAGLDDMLMNFELLFYNIGVALTPIVEQLITIGNFIANLFNKSQSAGMSKSTLQGLQKAYQYRISQGGTKKEMDEWNAGLNEVNQKLAAIEKKEAAINKLEKDKNDKYKKEVEAKITDEFKKQAEYAEKQAQAVSGITSSLLDLVPIESELGKQMKEVGVNIAEVGKQIQKIDFQNIGKSIDGIVKSGDIWTIVIKGLALIYEGLSNIINDIMNGTEATSNAYTDILATVKDINNELEYYNALLGYEQEVRNDSVEDFDNEIKAIKEVIKLTEERRTADQSYIDQANKDLDMFRKWREEILKVGGNTFWIDPLIAGLEEDIRNYTNEMIGLDTELVGYNNDIADLELAKAEFLEEQLGTQESITDEIEKQIDLMKQYFDLGMDPENIRTVKGLTKQLSSLGLSGVELGGALQQVGVQNRAIAGRTLNIFGDINNTLNQASVNQSIANLNSIISRIGGV